MIATPMIVVIRSQEIAISPAVGAKLLKGDGDDKRFQGFKNGINGNWIRVKITSQVIEMMVEL